MNIKGMTTKELASATGINEHTLSSYLKTSGSLPDIEKGLAIAKALDVSVNFLVNGIEDTSTALKDKLMVENFYRYSHIVNKINQIPEQKRSSVEKLISDLCETYTAD